MSGVGSVDAAHAVDRDFLYERISLDDGRDIRGLIVLDGALSGVHAKLLTVIFDDRGVFIPGA
jgi:hypothetical protein